MPTNIQTEKTVQPQSKWPIYLLIIVVIGSLITITLRVLTPPEILVPHSETLTTNYDGSQTNFSSIIYVGDNPEFPDKLPIARANNSTVTTEKYVVDQLISELSLRERENAINIWNGPEYSMAHSSSENRYSVSKNQVADLLKKETTTFSVSESKKEADDFIEKLFPDLDIASLDEHIEYYEIVEGDMHVHEDHASNNPTSETNAMTIPYAATINGFPVLYQNNSSFPFQIQVKKDNTVHKLVFYTFFKEYEKGNSSELISINQAIENINTNIGSVVKTEAEELNIFTLDSISSGKMDSVTLEYRVDDYTGLTYPYYRFSGEIEVPGQGTMYAEIITPAITTALPQN